MTIDELKEISETEISIKEIDTNKRMKVQQKECRTPHKTLGVYKTTIRDDTIQLEEFINKSINLALLVSNAKVIRKQGNTVTI